MNEKEFEKQQLEQLLNDLKDIDKYTSFKNGAFIYDLGKYQGSLLVNHINNLQSKIDKAIEYIEKDTRWFDYEYASVYGELCDCEGYNANRLEVMVNPSNLLNVLKEDK